MTVDFSQVTDWRIPEGDCIKVQDSTGQTIWQKRPSNPLKFTSQQNGSQVWFSDDLNPFISYSYDKYTWQTWSWSDGEASKITLDKNEFIYVRCSDAWGPSHYSRLNFHMTGKIAASGSIISLVDNYGDESYVPEDLHPYAFACLFQGCSALTSAPKLLTIDSLPEYCYQVMFKDCTSLIDPPELPSTKIADCGCLHMFDGCTSLRQAPELPATEVGEHGYEYMFCDCTSLTTPPPILPMTQLTYMCYNSMFYGCTSLISPPTISATKLAKSCCFCMFQGCSALTSAPKLLSTTLIDNCYSTMFADCSSLNVTENTGSSSKKIFTCPSIPDWTCVHIMFYGTAGSFTGNPTEGNTYYWN